MFRHFMLILVMLTLGLSTLIACSPALDQREIHQTEITHDDTILSWARQQHGELVYYPVLTFYGDFTGDGLEDALAWILYPSGGNSDFLDVALFQNKSGLMTYYRSIDNVFGGDPRDVVFEQGRVTLTTTIHQKDDPRCCPTGSRTWVINTE